MLTLSPAVRSPPTSIVPTVDFSVISPLVAVTALPMVIAPSVEVRLTLLPAVSVLVVCISPSASAVILPPVAVTAPPIDISSPDVRLTLSPAVSVPVVCISPSDFSVISPSVANTSLPMVIAPLNEVRLTSLAAAISLSVCMLPSDFSVMSPLASAPSTSSPFA